MRSFVQYSFFIAICAAIASCSPIVDQRGYSDTLADYSQIVVGQSRGDDVLALLGSPSAQSTYGQTTWYYIANQRETRGMFAPQVVKQDITAILFDTDGTVAAIEKSDKTDSKSVTYVEKTTPTEGRKLSAMEQLLGNFGKFNAPGREIDPRNLGR